MMTRKALLRLLALCVAAALLAVGAEGVMRRLGGSALELQRPDLLLALGICVLVYLGGSETEKPGAVPEP